MGHRELHVYEELAGLILMAKKLHVGADARGMHVVEDLAGSHFIVALGACHSRRAVVKVS